ncbi:MAG: HAD hydrolase-like protein [Staphylothermus sp.]|nr:HAD hydrolase-like protein [Staphylothermus sp.]
MKRDIVLAFDFDGVLVDSYRSIKDFYTQILPRYVNISSWEGELLYQYEHLADKLGLLRENWWFELIPGMTNELYDELITRYWEHRISTTINIPGANQVLEELSDKCILASISFRDDIYGLKKFRIEYHGFTKYFQDIIVIGEDFGSRADAFNYIRNKYGDKQYVYIDDKIINLWKLSKQCPWVKLVHLSQGGEENVFEEVIGINSLFELTYIFS